MKNLLTIFIFSALFTASIHGQAKIAGTITDNDNKAVFLANIAIEGRNIGTMTDNLGQFKLNVPDTENLKVVISCIGYISREFDLHLDSDESHILDITLEKDIRELNEVSISVRQERATSFQSIDISALDLLPNTTGGIETIIKTLPGVSSNNELSSQFNVRGGNFDENLIYVNGIQIYRPFLVRSGQQEGLSFINPDMISGIRFSAGGFDAQYGDKMSSVLDISYKVPKGFAGSVSGSLLGGSAHLEGLSKNGKLSAIAGFRYKTTAYLLNSLETTGNYQPQFADIQSLIRYSINPKLELSFLGNISLNKYSFIPESRKTEFGTASAPHHMKITYEGNETDQFDTYMGATTLKWDPSERTSLKFITSAFTTREVESFDILGQYWINELDNTIGSETFGDSIMNLGIGSFLNHARNYLEAYVYSASVVGEHKSNNHILKWGTSAEYQLVNDRISEWDLIDSSGYSVPTASEMLDLYNVLKSDNQLSIFRFSGFIQDTWSYKFNENEYYLTAGIRTTYLDLSQQFLVSPRINFSYKPYWERDLMFHLSTGVYYQPPFYKEMRDLEGNLNEDLKAQQSIHLVAGGDYIFSAWDRPFKFSTELYYKHLNNLVPYKVDNVRIAYAGENLASGYTMGIDFKINGEFVPGAESWVSMSLMQSREDIEGDIFLLDYEDGSQEYYEPGYYPRPTDQLMTFGLFFQDYLPNSPEYKVNLNFLYGSRLPYSSPTKDRYDNVYRLPPYRRVDIGFSKVLIKDNSNFNEGNPLNHIRNMWLSAEIFNLLGINNTISYLWVRTISNQEGIPDIFAVPNYLTSRRFNVKLTARF
ncbi:MAG: carboxypeptidase-like regulatory domain-containing protein [Bacteroidales bacterium]|nr:carboxypeptidase-like regulatory domain-containing protein [Bacteroidales bacterium]